MTSLAPDYKAYDYETTRLLGLCGTLSTLTAVHQKLVAEIVLLRLSYLFQNFVATVTSKLACGATYLDGTPPSLLIRARSVSDAQGLMKNHGRNRPKHNLSWSTASEIKENIRFIMNSQDSFVLTVDRNGGLIDEVRRVRNRIAHNNEQSRKNYKTVVRRYYGAYLNNITPGLLLLAERRRPCLLETYVLSQRVLAKEIVKI